MFWIFVTMSPSMYLLSHSRGMLPIVIYCFKDLREDYPTKPFTVSFDIHDFNKNSQSYLSHRKASFDIKTPNLLWHPRHHTSFDITNVSTNVQWYFEASYLFSPICSFLWHQWHDIGFHVMSKNIPFFYPRHCTYFDINDMTLVSSMKTLCPVISPFFINGNSTTHWWFFTVMDRTSLVNMLV